jgi:hypothetical protein
MELSALGPTESGAIHIMGYCRTVIARFPSRCSETVTLAEISVSCKIADATGLSRERMTRDRLLKITSGWLIGKPTMGTIFTEVKRSVRRISALFCCRAYFTKTFILPLTRAGLGCTIWEVIAATFLVASNGNAFIVRRADSRKCLAISWVT